MKKFIIILLLNCFVIPYSNLAYASCKYNSANIIQAPFEQCVRQKKHKLRAKFSQWRNFSDDDSSNSKHYSSGETVKRRKLIDDVGYNILNSNNIDKRMSFMYSKEYKTPNATTNLKTRQIVVNKGLMDLLDYDDELAFVIGHEISHAVDSYWGPFNGIFYLPLTKVVKRNIETRCDLRAIDYMVKAGYNPLGAIIFSNKLFTQPVIDWFSTHPSGSKRLVAMYLHIKNNYPEYLTNNKLAEDKIYQNFLITSQKQIGKAEKSNISVE